MEIQHESNTEGSAWNTAFTVRLNVGHGLTPRERAILLGSARRCEVNKLLTGTLRFHYGWADKV